MFKEGKLPMPINKPETLKKHSERMKLNNPNKGGACNHTSYPIRVYFEDGSEKDFEYMKQLTEERGIPYSSLKNARRNGTPLKIYSIKKVVKIEKIACEG